MSYLVTGLFTNFQVTNPKKFSVKYLYKQNISIRLLPSIPVKITNVSMMWYPTWKICISYIGPIKPTRYTHFTNSLYILLLSVIIIPIVLLQYLVQEVLLLRLRTRIAQIVTNLQNILARILLE